MPRSRADRPACDKKSPAAGRGNSRYLALNCAQPRAFSGEARGWEVAYRRAGSRDAPSFVDRGREIRIHDLRRDSVLAALQLSAQKWGTFQVFGSDNYKRLCADLAAEHGFRITNPELQQGIGIARERRHQGLPTRDAARDLPHRPLEPPLDPRPRGPGRGLGR